MLFFHQKLKTREKAQALIASYMAISTFIIISGIFLANGVNQRNEALRNQLANEVFYLAEGATENAIFSFITAIGDYQISPNIGSYSMSTVFDTFGSVSVDTTITSLESSDRLLLEGETNILVRNYEAVSTVAHPQNNTIAITLHQIFSRRLIPTFQHAVFYDADLEMLPGPDMTLTGRIHSNQDIYLDSHNTLTIDSEYLHSAGNIYNQRKDDASELGGDVSILVYGSAPPTYADMDNLDCDITTWVADAILRWQWTVQSCAHGVTTLAVPSVASIQPGGYYASNADLYIINGTLIKEGVVLTEGTDYPFGAVDTSTTFYNNREGQDIRMTEIDLGKLANIYGEVDAGGNLFPNNLPANGLLYATRDDAGASYQPGIRLSNASRIERDGGLTVVSCDPVYVRGDYNIINEKPASIIGDSLNLLSNNWDDDRDHFGVTSRPAAETTINSAFIAGIDETAPGNYNGGLENYPRLHENWSNIYLNIKGSFVALWESSIATGGWIYGDPQYTAPRRNWSYNTDFNDAVNLPPFTPWAVEAKRIAWWKE
ncbi:hypothetical protein ACFL1D_04240 [Candidatus Omnitrophota bacterium]